LFAKTTLHSHNTSFFPSSSLSGEYGYYAVKTPSSSSACYKDGCSPQRLKTRQVAPVLSPEVTPFEALFKRFLLIDDALPQFFLFSPFVLFLFYDSFSSSFRLLSCCHPLQPLISRRRLAIMVHLNKFPDSARESQLPPKVNSGSFSGMYHLAMPGSFLSCQAITP